MTLIDSIHQYICANKIVAINEYDDDLQEFYSIFKIHVVIWREKLGRHLTYIIWTYPTLAKQQWSWLLAGQRYHRFHQLINCTNIQ